MRTRKPLLAGLLAGMLALTLTLAVSPAGAAGAARPAPADPAGAAPAGTGTASTIPLITGDRVTVTAGGNLLIHRGEGREHIEYLTTRAGAHRYVIPGDAMPLLAAGRLDRRLFDVTALAGLGEYARGGLPLIMTRGDRAAGTPAALAAAGARAVRDLPAIGGTALRVDPAGAGEFWQGLTGAGTLAAGEPTVWLDGLRQPSLDQSVPQVGAPAAWAAGLDGSGVRVAVLDTGIDATHPDLADRVVGQQNFTEGFEDDLDRVGHGTHVASTLAGTGAASDGRFRGVAPGAELLDGKVCVEFGCADSWVIAGMQWAAEQGAAVVNLSLGGPDLPGLDPVEQAVADLTAAHGVLFVVAAGNAGAAVPVDSPASADAALAVGAVDKQDQLAFFSSRGPRIDGALKPDLTAPGVEIVAANSKDGFLGQPGEPYTTLSGTSMATPHVAGAAAILAQQHPDWSSERLKATLMAAAAPHPDLPVTAQGAGRLDVARAIRAPVTTGPASVSFDRQPGPHDDDPPQHRTIAYRNHGDAAVTLALSITATGPGGEPAPAGMFVASDEAVTVPAGGTAQVTLTADTTLGDQEGYFGGRLTGTAGDLVVQTPFGVEREVESYQLTLSHLDRNGVPTSNYRTILVNHDDPSFLDLFGAPEVTVRLPAGEYALASFLDSGGDDDDEEQEATAEAGDSTLLILPRLALTEDLTVPVDARAGELVSVAVTGQSTVRTSLSVHVSLDNPSGGVGFGMNTMDTDQVFTGQLGPAEPGGGVNTMLYAGLAVPPGDGNLALSGSAYHLAWVAAGEFVTGFQRTVGPDQLATVRSDVAAQVDGSVGIKSAVPLHPDAGVSAAGVSAALPLVRTEYFNTEPGIEWQGSLSELALGEDIFFETVILLEGAPTAYQPGQRLQERWNYAVHGPVAESGAVFRRGDELVVAPVLYGDGAGHTGFAPATGAVRVFRDGTLIAEEPSLEDAVVVTVPPEPAGYRVEVTADRDRLAPLSRRTELVWEFRSGHVDGAQPVPVPSVRFTPGLAPDNTARAGRPLPVPVSVHQAAGPGAGGLELRSVEVSFDDGASWQPVPVFSGRLALVSHPDRPGFVSLRAAATDAAGNTVQQTVLRAYEFS